MLTPLREEFLKCAKTGERIPIYREILADRLTPVSAFEKIAGGEGAFLLESVEGGERIGRYSFLGSDPYLIYRSKNGQITLTERGESRTESLAPGQDPLHKVEELLAKYRYVAAPELPRFCGGAVGFLGYDIVRYFERLPDNTIDDLNVDDCCLLFTDSLLIFDHVRHKVTVLCNARVDDDPGEAYDRAAAKIDELIDKLRAPTELHRPNPANHACEVECNMTREQFESAVARCIEYIAAGDAFQVVPSQRFSIKLHTHPFEVYRALRSLNPSPYMYYLDLGGKYIVGSSPEILVTVEDNVVRLRPIAGTRWRGATAEEDARLAEELLADEKERAEHIMLVDLGRNDVGRVCEYGSVRVDELMVIEKYSHVMHIVSDVVGKLSPGKSVFDVMRACFPAGTLSGAPKVRAMEIIEELEPTRRGLYGGAVGYFSFNGDMDFAIAIRTAWVDGDMVYVQAGGGVVYDSVPASEYQESVNKSRAVLTAVHMAEQGLE